LDLRCALRHAAPITDPGGAARRLSIALLVSLSLAVCANDDNSVGVGPTESATVSPTPTESPAATCDEPSQTKIELVAKNIHFSLKCLVVPANEPLTVMFQNKDFVNHNFSIYTLEFASEFTGDITYPNENVNYKVPALEPGQYLFQCDIHPADMSGPLIVR
jgi:plastocyanin